MVGGSLHSSRWSSSGGGSPNKLFWGGCWSSGHDFWTAAAARRSHSPVTCCNHVPHLQELRKMNIIEAERDEDMYLTWCSVQVPVRVHSYEIQHCERISLSWCQIDLFFFIKLGGRCFLSFCHSSSGPRVPQWNNESQHRLIVSLLSVGMLLAASQSVISKPGSLAKWTHQLCIHCWWQINETVTWKWWKIVHSSSVRYLS